VSKIISKIRKPIDSDVLVFNAILKDNLKSDVGIINSIVNYLIKTKGKQYRAVLSLLCSRLDGKEPNDSTYLSAITVEVLHVATLLHDDVVDDSDIRRGWPTINKIWKNKLSILVGDYLFSKALSNTSQFNDLNCINTLSDISKRLSEGEIMQIEKAINKDISEKEYFKMISDKTASLISAACYLGYYSNDKNEIKGESVKKFGEYLGIAYQIKDDVFDIVGNIDNTGKKSNLDLKKNMLTLPFIHCLSKLNSKEKNIFLRNIKKSSSSSDIGKIKKMVNDLGGLDYAQSKIEEFSILAKNELSIFKDSSFKDSLLLAVDFNISRKF
jgi:octaprenyl-diphosphate synthase